MSESTRDLLIGASFAASVATLVILVASGAVLQVKADNINATIEKFKGNPLNVIMELVKNGGPK